MRRKECSCIHCLKCEPRRLSGGSCSPTTRKTIRVVSVFWPWTFLSAPTERKREYTLWGSRLATVALCYIGDAPECPLGFATWRHMLNFAQIGSRQPTVKKGSSIPTY